MTREEFIDLMAKDEAIAARVEIAAAIAAIMQVIVIKGLTTEEELTEIVKQVREATITAAVENINARIRESILANRHLYERKP